jgi:hypothetical protein
MKLKHPLFLLFFSLFLTSVQAELLFEQDNIVGDVTVNDLQYKAVFNFKNTGKSPVKIKDIKTSCGCTTARMQKHSFEPGESGSVEVVFVFGYRRGVQHKDVIVVTDEGAFGGDCVYALSLSVLIPEKYSVTKRSHHWNVGENATPWSFTIKLHPEWNAKFDSIECRKEGFEYSYAEDAEAHTVTVTVAPKDVSQKLRDIMNVYLDDGSGEKKKISIFLSLRDE